MDFTLSHYLIYPFTLVIYSIYNTIKYIFTSLKMLIFWKREKRGERKKKSRGGEQKGEGGKREE